MCIGSLTKLATPAQEEWESDILPPSPLENSEAWTGYIPKVYSIRTNGLIGVILSIMDVRMKLLSQFLLVVTFTTSWAFLPRIVSTGFDKCGVTSIASSDEGITFIGTKNGQLLTSRSESCTTDIGDWKRLSGHQTRYPVYSLATVGRKIFAGGGDRLISVWSVDGGTDEFIGTLGPHTGWVKDLLYFHNDDILFSIGCNCIESWNCSRASMNHVSKRTIENSVELGATLSSDLLCMCSINGEVLASGGVDGRIHLWSFDPRDLEPLFCVPAHAGRVSSIVFSSELNALFSVGYDGTLAVFLASYNRLEQIALFSFEGCPRLTHVCIIETKEGSCTCAIAIGTADGEILFVSLQRRGESVSKLVEKRLCLNGDSMIYSICPVVSPENKTDDSFILVGHASGLDKIRVPPFL